MTSARPDIIDGDFIRLVIYCFCKPITDDKDEIVGLVFSISKNEQSHDKIH